MKFPSLLLPARPGALAILAGLALILAGCSSTKLAYEYADWGIVWWVDDYIPMTDQQEAQLERDVRDLRDWHCSTQLPRYSEWLAELKQDVRSGDLDQSTVSHHQEQLFSFFSPLLDRAKPAATRLLSSLSNTQVQALADNMAESQAELEEEFLAESAEQTRQARAERTRERVERWLGDLNSRQAEMVQQWSDARGKQTEIWLEGRRNWQKALLDALDQRGSEDFDQRIGYLIDNNEKVRGPRYQSMIEESRAAMASLMTDLLQQADQTQLDHLLERAADLRGDFNALACA
jgi:uncharacterized protein DUF6279